MKQQSAIWQHYEKISEKKVRCKKCQKEYSSCENYTSLKKHLNKHGINTTKTRTNIGAIFCPFCNKVTNLTNVVRHNQT